MNPVEIGKVYRHFKGNYYFVENVACDSETKERMVVYKPLYPREDGNYIWVRPDNITGQKHRFEVAQDLTLDYTKK